MYLKKLKYLNEVLLNWEDDDFIKNNNEIISSNLIKSEIEDPVFIYRQAVPSNIRSCSHQLCIFNPEWPEFIKYRGTSDKVYVNGEPVAIGWAGWTGKFDKFSKYTGPKDFPKGDYKVIIKDLDKITDCTGMFMDTHIVYCPFFYSTKIEKIDHMFARTKFLDDKTKKLWKKVYSFN